jgi:hypothetical protein
MHTDWYDVAVAKGLLTSPTGRSGVVGDSQRPDGDRPADANVVAIAGIPDLEKLTGSEAEFQARVIALARAEGWKVAHFRAVRIQRADGSTYYQTPVQADGSGWPDLFMVRDGVALAPELKTNTGRVRPEQQEWLAALRAAGIAASVWRPKDWNLISAALRV